MRQESAVAIFAFLVGGVLLYTALSSRESLDEFRRGDRESLRLKRTPSPRPGLLSLAPSVRPSAASGATPIGNPPRTADDEKPVSYAPDSLCGFYGGLWRGSERDYDRALGEQLTANGPRDDSTELFLAMESGDWDAVADFGRSERVPGADEIAFLARTGLIDRLSAPGSGKEAAISLDPRDLDAIDEFRRRDPRNSFWPLAEAYLKQKENVPNDRETLIAEAASLPDYRNPVTAFYGGVRRRILSEGDDRAFLAYANLETRMPMLDGSFYRSLGKDVGRNPENDEMIGWIGKTMVGAPFFETENPGPEAFMDAFSGGVLMNAADKGKSLTTDERRAVYDQFSKRFEVNGDEGLIESTLKSGCVDENLADRIQALRRRATPGESQRTGEPAGTRGR